MTNQEEIRRLRQLAIDLILIMPEYPGCGDFSREQRTYEDARRLLGDAMPEKNSMPEVSDGQIDALTKAAIIKWIANGELVI